MQSYFLEKIREYKSVESQFIQNLIREERGRWLSNLYFVDSSGNVVPYLNGENDRARVAFIDAVDSEIRRKVHTLAKTPLELINELSRSDAASWKKWYVSLKASSQNFLPYYHGLSKRAKKAAESINHFTDELHHAFKEYFIFAPHSFCFAPFKQEDKPDLEKKLSGLLDTDRWFPDERGRLKFSSLIDVYHAQDHFVNVMGYLSRYKPSFKLKMYSKHFAEELTDTLDVEAQFKGNTFEDIVHFHVEKPHTRKCLTQYLGEASPHRSYHFELSKHLKTGNVIVKNPDLFGERTVRTDEEAMGKKAIAIRQWKHRPVVVGGALLSAIIDYIKHEPKFEALQHYALHYGK